MKKTFQVNELAHIWAKQNQSEGKTPNGSFYFEGATIFSYGAHFPIATIEGNDVLFTTRSYSNTTAKHISKTRQAISHKNIIYCKDVPVKYKDGNLKKMSFTLEHKGNINYWKDIIKARFAELGNKKNRDIEGRINSIQQTIQQLNSYVQYFGIKIKDKELKKLLSIVGKPDFIELAKSAKEKQDLQYTAKFKQSEKAYQKYISLWRNFDTEGITGLPENIKTLVNFYTNQSESFTRLRFNPNINRIESSKGVQIPVEIAKRAYIQLNGCLETNCKDLSIYVMDYTITETSKEYIKAGCHTIPKEDVRYIASLLKW